MLFFRSLLTIISRDDIIVNGYKIKFVRVHVKNFINQQDMKEINVADVFSLVKNRGALTRKQISEKLGISWGAVSTITAKLIEEGYIIERKAESDGAAGRIPSYLEVNRTKHFAIGLDVNDMGLYAVIVDLKGEVVSEFQAEADLDDKNALLEGIYTLLDSVVNFLGDRHLICIGVAMQGIVNASAGVSVRIPGRDDWENIPLAELISQRFSVPTVIEHDPNCILFAARRGKITDTLLVRVDYGIGMALMLGGRIIDKPGIFELGHTVAVPEGIECNCGKCGCLDQYASIRGLKARSKKKFHVLISDADIGDKEALKYINDAAKYLAFSIANATFLLNVDRVVLCGRLFEHKDLFWDEFVRNFEVFSGNDLPKFSFAEVSAAPHGAALIAMGTTLRKISI